MIEEGKAIGIAISNLKKAIELLNIHPNLNMSLSVFKHILSDKEMNDEDKVDFLIFLINEIKSNNAKLMASNMSLSTVPKAHCEIALITLKELYPDIEKW